MAHKETTELPLLIEGYKKEIWEWKQKESQWIKDQNQLEGSKRIIEELSTKIIKLEKDKNNCRSLTLTIILLSARHLIYYSTRRASSYSLPLTLSIFLVIFR